MADKTKIEWADATVNAINGCTVTSPGCTNCYAMKLAGTRMRNHLTRKGLTIESKAGPVWTGEVRLHEPALLQPLSWKKPRRIFWNAHGDTFHENVPDEWIDRIFAVAKATPQHTHMILTKRAARMREYVTSRTRLPDSIAAFYDLPTDGSVKIHQPLRNVWLGVSVEDQTRADERIPDLLATPAVVRFLSCEPLLGPVDLTRIMEAGAQECFHSTKDAPFKLGDRTWTETRSSLNSLTGHYWGEDLLDGTWEGWLGEEQPSPGFGEKGYYSPIDWVIAGGESGPSARPMHPDWLIRLRDQCEAAGVPFHFKQWGEYLPIHAEGVVSTGYAFRKVGKKAAGRRLHGQEHDGFPGGAV
jgi:protein gp37